MAMGIWQSSQWPSWLSALWASEARSSMSPGLLSPARRPGRRSRACFRGHPDALARLDRHRCGARPRPHLVARHRGLVHRRRASCCRLSFSCSAASGQVDAAARHRRSRSSGSSPGPDLRAASGGSLEHVAGRLVPLRLEPNTVIVREGDAGDRFYIVAEGEIEVSQDRVPITNLTAGGHFGEIALLRDVPRTATVTARTSAVLYALDRDDFLAAVTGHPQSAEAAETVMAARLSGPAVNRLSLVYDYDGRAHEIDAVLDAFHTPRPPSRRGALLRSTGNDGLSRYGPG